MADKEFDFWQDHSLNYLNMALSHDRQERLENPDGYGKRTGECGDTVEIFLMIRKNRIEIVSYEIDGCMNTNASAAALVEMAEGLDIDSAWKITDQTLIDFLETIPEESFHCAELAVGAFYLALSDYQNKAVQADRIGKT
ncbi:iron-sulfur cluster assembly scaffold protein NifU [Desulfospira joergensenii]|uniref:iron-sulfur cluster assembly scaffold protein NifU n=1 Tax=Desulfospira joergensenii TaxID=53329 RepID=UPI0003B62146|nr:iron-sulfur cluster assembly scaffold protein NifU [Desulfospira joergensenii]